MNFNPLEDYGQHNLKDPDHLLKWNFSELIKTLITLSADPARQIEYIGKNESPGEEMLLDFESFFGLSSRKYVQTKLLRFDQVEALDELGLLLSQMEEESLTYYGVLENPEWDSIREKARSILDMMQLQTLDLKVEETIKDEEKIGGEKKATVQRRRIIVEK